VTRPTRQPKRQKLRREELRPPTCPQSERALVGCILLDQDQIAVVASIVAPGDFTDPLCKSVYAVAVDIEAAGGAVDMVSVFEEMARRGLCDGDQKILADIAGFEHEVSVSAVAPQHARRIAETARLRRLGAIAVETYKRVCQGQDEEGNLLSARQILSGAETAIVKLQNEEIEQATRPIAETVIEVVDRAEKVQNGTLDARGTLTHYIDLDRYTSGFQPGNLWILGARPSIGKTAFACNLAHNIAKGGPVIGPSRVAPADALFLSLEMTREEITQRILCSLSGIPIQKIRDPKNMRPEEISRLAVASQRVGGLPIDIDDTAALRPRDLRAKARLWHAQAKNPAVIFLDHLNLMEPDFRSRDGRVNDMTSITKGLKALAKELNLTVVALCQLNRRIEHRAKADGRLPPPMLSDLRESGSIEQDADVVLFLHRDRIKDEAAPTEFEHPQECKLIIGKHRNGPEGNIPMMFKRQICTFFDGVRNP